MAFHPLGNVHLPVTVSYETVVPALVEVEVPVEVEDLAQATAVRAIAMSTTKQRIRFTWGLHLTGLMAAPEKEVVRNLRVIIVLQRAQAKSLYGFFLNFYRGLSLAEQGDTEECVRN